MRKLLVALGGLFLCLTVNAQNTAVGSLTASGTDCTTAGACITLQFESNDVASASIQLSGTFTATVQFEASSDKGTTWVAISGTPLNSSTAVTSATTANTWKFNVASITNIRARCSAFTSAPTVVIRSSRAVANAIGGGGASLPALSDDGTNINSTEAILAPTGTTALPGYAFSGHAADGITVNSSNQVGLIASNGALGWWQVNPNASGVSTGSTTTIGWNSGTTIFGGGIDTALSRDGGAGIMALKQSTTTDAKYRIYGANGGFKECGASSELLTLSTVGTTTDTTANLLPANSIIEAVTTNVTTTITTAVSFSVGDATTAARFSASAGGMTSGSTRIGIDQMSGAVTTLAAGPSQASAAKVRITTNANPGAGVIRIQVHYCSFTAPTS